MDGWSEVRPESYFKEGSTIFVCFGPQGSSMMVSASEAESSSTGACAGRFAMGMLKL